MRLFEFDKNTYTVHITEEALLLDVFNTIYKKDKSKGKDVAMKEFTFIWFYCDVTSPYQLIIDLIDREAEIKRDIGLANSWKQSEDLKKAVEFYNDPKFWTIVRKMYNAAIIAASAINSTLLRAKELIEESDDQIAAAEKIIRTLERVPKVMQTLREAEKELIREIEDKEGKKKGSKTFNLYEDGLKID
jgi:hypothetical protein